MAFWSDRILPHVLDKGCNVAEVIPLRERACRGLRGRVLEIGFGSGFNVGVYPADVAEVAAVEPSDVAWGLSEQRRTASAVRFERSGLDEQALLEQDESCDTALCTFTLCSIPDPGRALDEVSRVLKPGGTLHFLEHGLAPTDRVARWQARLEPFQKRVFGGCHLTRHPPSLLESAGFKLLDMEESYLPGPPVGRPWSYGYLGLAQRL